MLENITKVVRFSFHILFRAEAHQALIMNEGMHVSLVDACWEDVESKVKFPVIYQEGIVDITLNDFFMVSFGGPVLQFFK